MGSESLYEEVMRSVPAGAAPRPRIKASAGVVPWRRRGGELEVFWVERARTLPFMGGFFAFPGGGRARRDAELAVSGRPLGADESAVDAGLPEAVLGGLELEPVLAAGILGCALREAFEETGLLLGSGAGAEHLAAARRRLLAGETTFAAVVAELGLELDASKLVYAGRWLTPAFGPVRFDNRFFLLEWAETREVQPEVCGSELVAGEWVAPSVALERWRRGEIVTAPPILHILEVLAEDGPEAGLARLRDTTEANIGPVRRIEFRPGILLVPLLSPTLPPAGRTNAYIVGTGEVVLVDPGSPYDAECERLVAALAALAAEGKKLAAIWLTHHHPDHVGGVDAVRRAFDVPVCAHRSSAERLAPRGLKVDRVLEDGERVVLAGEPPMAVRVLHTPGHTRGHLAFYVEAHGSLIGGDLTAGIGTIVIDPPEGDMDEYLGSLRRVAELGARTLFPAHGPPTLAVREKLEEYVRHRLWREDRVRTAWSRGLRGPELLAEVYEDVPEVAVPLARRQLAAHLERLERRGEIDNGAAAEALA